MQVTIQTKIPAEATKFLEDTATYTAKKRGKLLKALLAGGKIVDLKKEYIREHGLLARQFNSLVNEVKALIKSSKELHKLNLQESRQRRTSLKKTIKSLTKKQKKTYPACGINGQKPPRKKLQFQIHQKKRKLGKLEAKIKKLEASKGSICLGSKKLFRAQFNLEANGYKDHQEWLADFRKARSNRIFYLGSHDESFGNQNCQLLGNKLLVRVVPALEKKYGQYVEIPIQFKYGQEIINNGIASEQAMNYRFVRKGDQWYLFVTTRRKNVKIATKRGLGAIGVDINKAHLAWAEVDRYGNLVDFGRLQTPIQDRSSGQITATFGDAIKQILKHAQKQQKPIVIEELDFSRRKAAFEGKSIGYRRMLSHFAYSKFYQIMHARAFREGVEVIDENPAFSSIIGKYKFAFMYGISVHIAAGLVLARRGLRFSERLPANYARCLAVHKHRHVWSSWRAFAFAVSNRDKRVELCSRRPLLKKPPSSGESCPLLATGVGSSSGNRG